MFYTEISNLTIFCLMIKATSRSLTLVSANRSNQGKSSMTSVELQLTSLLRSYLKKDTEEAR